MTAVLAAFLLGCALAVVSWGREANRAGPAPVRSVRRGSGATSPWSVTGRRRRGRAAERAATEMLDVLDALAPALRAGLPPIAALRLVTRSASAEAITGSGRSSSLGSGALHDLAEAAAQGGPLAPTWSAYADALSSSDLRLVASAWSLCDTLGSPLAPTVATVADVVRRRRTVRQRVDAASAGPVATMRVLTALPLTGPLVALAVGVSPGDLYAEPAGAASLAVGLVLLLAGSVVGGSPGRGGGGRAAPVVPMVVPMAAVMTAVTTVVMTPAMTAGTLTIREPFAFAGALVLAVVAAAADALRAGPTWPGREVGARSTERAEGSPPPGPARREVDGRLGAG